AVMRQFLVIGFCALFIAPASARDRGPDWVKRPTADDIMAVWPGRAMREGYGGSAVLSCIVTVQGTLRDCRVESETPQGGGFAGAALVLSSQFVMRPALKGGVPIESAVRIPINFPRPARKTGSHIRPATDTDIKGPAVYRKLPWLKAPTVSDVLAAYPEKAKAERVAGSAALSCRIGRDGRLSACEILRELPERYGFGAAARKLAPLFETSIHVSNGRTLSGGYAQLTVAFAASSLDAPNPVIGRPEWLSLPSPEDMSTVVPSAAKAGGVWKARAVILCDVGGGGDLQNCAVQSEEPAELGYGAAAVSLSQRFKLSIWTDEGLPTIGGKVRVPIRFDLQGEDSPATPSP
ncbi:MAG: energy transducer TonB, partial [Phenylobacterium sp.]|nr:energy transducer TonB [Phenylobacterium sp.]